MGNMFQVLAQLSMSQACDAIPKEIRGLCGTVVNLIKIAVPILLIIFGMLDLGKAVMAQKEDEIKKGQQTFIKRVIAAVIVFFVVAITQMVVGLIASSADEDEGELKNCIDQMVGNK